MRSQHTWEMQSRNVRVCQNCRNAHYNNSKPREFVGMQACGHESSRSVRDTSCHPPIMLMTIMSDVFQIKHTIQGGTSMFHNEVEFIDTKLAMPGALPTERWHNYHSACLVKFLKLALKMHHSGRFWTDNASMTSMMCYGT